MDDDNSKKQKGPGPGPGPGQGQDGGDVDFTKKAPVIKTREGTARMIEELTDAQLADREGKFRLAGDRPGQHRDLVGIKAGDLEEARGRAFDAKRKIEMDLTSLWKCVRCKRVWEGKDVRIAAPERDGEEAVYKCAGRGCGGAVVRVPGGVAPMPRLPGMGGVGGGHGGLQ